MNKVFNIKKQVLKTPEQAYAELLGDSSENQIVELNIDAIDEIDNQPQKIHEDKIGRIIESMKIVGQLDPIIVIPNPKKENRYLLIAGRHRRRACIQLGLDTVKAVIKKETNPDKQRLMLLATNNDRNTDYAPSELAFSYLEQMQLLQKLGNKATASKVAEENNTNRKTVHKYVQLTKLIPPLLSRVDSNSITVGAGYELSFLSNEKQTVVINYLLNHSDYHITKETARAIRENPDDIDNILAPPSDTVDNHSEKTESNVPKAEKKINLNNQETKKCPSEGHLAHETSYEVLMTLAHIIRKNAHSVLSYLISNYPTTDEVINLINNKYVSNDISFQGHLDNDDNLPILTYFNSDYSVAFKKKLVFKLTTDTKKKEAYKISYYELDKALRKYLRKFVSTEDKIIAIKEQESK